MREEEHPSCVLQRYNYNSTESFQLKKQKILEEKFQAILAPKSNNIETRVGRDRRWLVSANRCSNDNCQRAERCVSKIAEDADVSVVERKEKRVDHRRRLWNVEEEEERRRRKKWACALEDEEKECEDWWIGRKVRHDGAAGRKEDEPTGRRDTWSEKGGRGEGGGGKMEGGGATRPSNDLMSSPSPGLK